MSELDRGTLEDLLAKAHAVVVGTTQDTLRKDAAYYPHLIKARNEYLKARIDAKVATSDNFGYCWGSVPLRRRAAALES